VNLRFKIAAAGVAVAVVGILIWLVVTATRDPAPAVPMSELPPQAAQTWQLIRQGGPFPYPQDGQPFPNRDGVLPGKPDGYYREYAVPTPDEPDRGNRRLVTGEGGELYYTADAFRSFLPVDPDR